MIDSKQTSRVVLQVLPHMGAGGLVRGAIDAAAAQVKAGWRLLQDKFSGRAVYVNGDMVTDTRPDEETGEVIEPPPLSQALADMGWRKCYLLLSLVLSRRCLGNGDCITL